ncbi:hypothetical protein B0E52_14105 [Rhodanobacter sp. C06]|uniref:hypothetical protein n=1 Tax=Rhodanobacter sp. C06 TaxID=1945854 RepID=UPI000986919A|nr:hypothetical protein [Rhodanobacter sp. C06]OOG38474.1 hypothetical protein B0E52_14105 [Rhodanobacter sp. C06]
MNHDLPPFDDPAREHEWQAQERALDAERHGLDPAADDARVRRYRLLARALREPMPVALPADFARRMAAQVAAAPSRRQAAGTRFESTLASTLVVMLVVAGGVVLAYYGNTWLPAFRDLLPSLGTPATGWLLALGGCIGASWLLGLWQRHTHGPAA